jgi:antitoxin component YwqK of YwqJK toxin-antitoxin module
MRVLIKDFRAQDAQHPGPAVMLRFLPGAMLLVLLAHAAPGQEIPAAPVNDRLSSLPSTTPIFSTQGIETIRDRYPDGKVQIERQVVINADGDYVNHGVWTLLDPKGGVLAEGRFDAGNRIGPWSRSFTSREASALSELPFKQFKPPFLSQVNFVDNEMEGEWIITDSTHRKCMQASLKAGKRDGSFTLWLPTGGVYRQATYKEGKLVGDVHEADSKTGALTRTATYLDGRKLSAKTEKTRDGKRIKSEEQILEAPLVQRTPDDFWTLALAEYAPEGESVLHGPSKLWFDNGKVEQQGFYELGKKSGPFTFYHESGQVAATGDYKDDLPNDIWVWWHPNGQRATVGYYRDGALVGQWRWWAEDGTLTHEQTHDGSQRIADGAAPMKTAKGPDNEQIR